MSTSRIRRWLVVQKNPVPGCEGGNHCNKREEPVAHDQSVDKKRAQAQTEKGKGARPAL
jgi:hypothetical protein